MIVYTLVGLTLTLAFISLFLLWRSTANHLKYSWHKLLSGISIAAVTYLYGTWIYLSIYLKYAFGILCAVVLIAGMFRKKQEQHSTTAGKAFSTFFSLIMITLAVLYFTGTTGVPETVELQFPLKKGRYFILQGGKGLPSNLFHYTYRGAIYAIDIVKLNKYGNRASHVFTSRLEDYQIFNDTVYSPCDGRIVRARNDNPDNIPPSRERGPSNTNQLVIEAANFYVFMAHLKHNGVLVGEEDVVKTGQPIALVGNSGYTLEPHLHIQAHKKTREGSSWYEEEPLYIAFDGRTYLLFETITPRRVHMPHK